MSKKRKQSSQSASGTSFQSKDASRSAATAITEVGPEPKANRAAVPVFFIVVLGAILFWGDMYLVNHGGELDARVYAPYRSVAELASYRPKGAEDLLKAQGQQVYKLYCAACHQDDGNGNPSSFVPPLAASDWVTAKTQPHHSDRAEWLAGPDHREWKAMGAGSDVALARCVERSRRSCCIDLRPQLLGE
jgi:mono/diheme cytochrome c family protein